MAHPTVWPTYSFFYPIGNTAPIDLLKHSPTKPQVDVLLLGCGDPRNILYTVYANGGRISRLDFTCCDWEPAIFARNILLFTLLRREDYEKKKSQIWNIFYHFFIEDASLSLLVAQCAELVSASVDLLSWVSSPFSAIEIGNSYTLAELHRLWSLYLQSASYTGERKSSFKLSFEVGMGEAFKKAGAGIDVAAARSAGPLRREAMKVVTAATNHFRKTGTTFTSVADLKTATNLNPTFAFANQGEGFVAHYATTFPAAFHLAPIFASSPDEPSTHETSATLDDVFDSARSQFHSWCEAFRQAIEPSHGSPTGPDVTVRVVVADALAFCSILANISPHLRPPRVASWRASILDLSGFPDSAPRSFDVIDTSNLCDHYGTLNILLASRLLLRQACSSILYTETMLPTTEDPTTALGSALCGDLMTMSILFDLSPVSFVTGYTTQSNSAEVLGCYASNNEQYHERMSWRIPSRLGRPEDPLQMVLEPAVTAKLLYNVYLRMFSHENQLPFLFGKKPTIRTLQQSSCIHYNRTTFAYLILYLSTTISADWMKIVEQLVGIILADRRLTIGMNYIQELLSQLYSLGLYRESSFVPERRILSMNKAAGPFRDWNSTPPPVVYVAFTVPRSNISIIEREDAPPTPFLAANIVSAPLSNIIQAIDTVFGSISVEGTAQDRIGIITEDCRWKQGDSSVVVIVPVPTWMLTNDPKNTTISLIVVSTPASALLIPKLGFRLSLFDCPLTDTSRVHVFTKRPTILDQKDMQSESLVALGPPVSTKTSDVFLSMDDTCEKITAFTRRVNLENDIEKSALSAKDAVVEVRQVSPSTVQLFIGTLSVRFLSFPFVVEASKARLRIARKSSWVEVILPPSLMWKGLQAGKIENRFPLVRRDSQSLLWNIHHVPLDRLPILSFESTHQSQPQWFNLHLTLALSDRELGARRSSTMNGLASIKDDIQRTLMAASGLENLPGVPRIRNAFAFCQTSKVGSIDSLLFITDLRLDLASHTVVADAFVLPLHHTLFPRIQHGLNRLMDVIIHVGMSDEASLAWKALLPSLVERCRTWDHTADCAYSRPGATIPLSVEHGELPICDCGRGIVTDAFRRHTDWKPFLPFVTRIAISPLCAVSYLEPIGGMLKDMMDARTISGTRRPPQSSSTNKTSTLCNDLLETMERAMKSPQCNTCHTPLTEIKPMICSRCKKATYCGRKCQEVHWKIHKSLCRQI